VSYCSNCSGGSEAGNLGGGTGNDVTFTNVTVPAAGTYQMEIDYLTSGPRSYFVSVNGAAATELDLNGSSFSLPTSTVVPVTLKAGVNTISFGNASGYSPGLDRIAISPVVGTSDVSGSVTAKVGFPGLRLWQVTVGNDGSALAKRAEVNQFSLTQDGGSGSCHPKVLALFPLQLGQIAPGVHQSVEVPIDFSRCSANARFDSSIVFSANNGADVSSIAASGGAR
jgi:alpha-galactosidase